MFLVPQIILIYNMYVVTMLHAACDLHVGMTPINAHKASYRGGWEGHLPIIYVNKQATPSTPPPSQILQCSQAQ